MAQVKCQTHGDGSEDVKTLQGQIRTSRNVLIEGILDRLHISLELFLSPHTAPLGRIKREMQIQPNVSVRKNMPTVLQMDGR